VPFIREIALLCGRPLDLEIENNILAKAEQAFSIRSESKTFVHVFGESLKIPVEFKAEKKFPEMLVVTARSGEFTARQIKLIAGLMTRYIFVQEKADSVYEKLP